MERAAPAPDPLAVALAAHAEGRLDEAERLCRSRLAECGSDAKARALLAAGRFSAGNPGGAAVLLCGAVALEPSHAGILANLGTARLALGHGGADDALRRALRLDPGQSEAAMNLGALRSRQGRHEEAVAAFRHALSLDPVQESALYNLALSEQALGRLDPAVQLGRRAVAVQPDQARTLNNLGYALLMQAIPALMTEAAAVLSAAVRLDPVLGVAHRNRGEALRRRDEHAAAAASFRRAAVLDPGDGEAFNGLGLVWHHQGHKPEAVAAYRHAVRAAPAFPSALINLGAALQGLGWGDEAEDCYRRVLSMDPGSPEALGNLGTLYQERGDTDQAAACFRQAIGRRSDHTDALNNLGLILQRQGKTDEALVMISRALMARPDFPIGHNNLGTVLYEMGRSDLAAAAYQEALKLDPALSSAFSNLGNLLKDMGEMAAAAAAFRRALVVRPGLPEPMVNLAAVLQLQGNIAESLALYQEVLAIRPDMASAASNRLLTLNYSDSLDAGTVFTLHRDWGRGHGNRPPVPRPPTEPLAGRRLRVGYVSPDFRSHAVSRFAEALLSAHDRTWVEVFCYAEVARPDEVTRRLRRQADHWRVSVGMTDDELARCIAGDRLDVLVDLAGHTAGNRLTAFALRPAPVQASWLGYPNTTGLPAMDYRITDAVADPPGGDADRRHTERLLRLPDGFLCFQPPADAPDPGPPPRDANGRITFGSFNNIAKISGATIAAWAAILERVPGSDLLIKTHALTCPGTRQQFLDRLTAAGIDRERIRAMGWIDRNDHHMAAYGLVDIALDPFPYNGTTTTCEALWMGVPVIVRRGDRHAARVGASLLARVGLDELVAEDTEDYIARAVALAGDRARLAGLRAGLRRRLAASPLTDAAGFARRFEEALFTMAADAPSTGAAEAPDADMTIVSHPVDAVAATEGDARRRLERAVAAVPFWYHRIALPHGVTTPGWAPLHPGAYRLPERLDGLRVLDVGAWDGYWGFEALRRGAAEVVAIDDLSDTLDLMRTPRDWRGFDLCREALGWPEDRCRRLTMSVYDLRPEVVGTFDVVLCFGVLNQWRHPLLGLDALSRVCTGEMIVETGTLDHFSPFCGGLGQGYEGGHMVMEFYPGAQYANNPNNWWAPTLDLLGNLLRSCGFAAIDAWPLVDSPRELAQCRGFVRASRGPHGHATDQLPALPLPSTAAARCESVPTPFRLHIGGVEPREGWRILNGVPGAAVDYVGDCSDLSRFPSACCDAIYASHVLEHLPYGDRLSRTLGEFHRVLKPGAQLMVSVPNLETLCRLYLRPDLDPGTRFQVTRMMYGGQTDRYDFHFCGFDRQHMTMVLENAGFHSVRPVEAFDLFHDTSAMIFAGEAISLNVIAKR